MKTIEKSLIVDHESVSNSDRFSSSGSLFVTSLIAATLALPAISSKAATVTTPNGVTSTEGNSNNSFPFNLAGDSGEVPSGTQRYQQIYSSSEFSALSAGGEYITRIAFRPDATFGAAFASTLPDIRIDLSTTAAGVDALSSTFASNVGANDTIVYGGSAGAALSFSSSFTGPAGGPKSFDIIINLTTPFLYNPAAGNLLM